MLHRRIVLIAALALAACSPPSPREQEAAPASDPAEVIRPLYERYLTDPAATTFPALEEQAPWSASMRQALVDMMARSRVANEPILDADPFVLAQDWRISAVAVSTDSVVANSHAVVRARFVNIGQPREVLFDMTWEGGGWRVDNIRGEDFDLRETAARRP